MTEETPIIRELPHAQVSEKWVLSRLMREPELIDESGVSADWFYIPAHRVIFRELVASKTDDAGLILQRLHQRGELDDAGGPATIAELMTYAVGPHLERHLAEFRGAFVRRMAIAALTEAAEAAFDASEGMSAGNYLDALSGPITAIFDAAAGARPVKGIKALASDFLTELEEKIAGVSLPDGVPTGIHEIDRHLRGMKPQQMGIISARSGGGKSTLATQIFGNVTDTLYLILERTEKSAFNRTIVQRSGLHHGAVLDPRNYAQMQGRTNPDKSELIAIRTAVQSIVEGNRHIVKPSNRKLATITAEIRRYVRKHGVKIVFLDQIGLVRGERIKGDSGEAELRGISNTLQELTHELGIHLIVLCQVNAEGDTKNARAIEEDADWWMSIIQERNKQAENYGEHQHVLIAKDSHHGSAGERLPLILDKETLRFVHGFPAAKEEKPQTRFNR